MIAISLARSAFSSPNSSHPFFRLSRHSRSWSSYGLNSALAGKGVLVQDQAFPNLKSTELFQKGATLAESLSGLPIYVRGHALRGSSEISKPQFTKLLKQVTSHISSISNIYVHDGAIGSRSKCNVKIRMISDGPSSILAFSNIVWETTTRAISHDSCPLTVYAAESISPGVGNTIGLGAGGDNGFIAADIERSMLILCGKAFSDTNGTKETLVALSEPVIFARGGLPLPARLLVSGDSVVLLFAPEDVIQNCAAFLVSKDAGVILSSEGVVPFFQIGNTNANGPRLFKSPSAIVLVTSDDSRTIPSASKLCPGQAAYHFLAGYQNGKFVAAFHKGPSSIDPLELAKALLCMLKEQQIPSFLVNAKGMESAGKDLVTLVESALSMNIPPFQTEGGELKRRYKSFVSEKYQQLPEDFSF
ncbi:uncharacterized protein LOC111794671 isoform X1 [Cucurbita pepo subsp. pepo]|uniref:uncharacterized protein LOC111794671 isoform X1 n=1 Tax=Cucurbita pepo subsp. pepo TaxID=3664 RepID=UPI000C9D6B4F|nr:uncharacterized protein LOC111794671 isoform X1 [Cucurbita pepo subsp. pepo]